MLDAILGKSSPKKQSLGIGDGLVSQANLIFIYGHEDFCLLKAANCKFEEPNKHRDYSRIDFMSSLNTSWSDYKASCRQQRGPVIFSMDLCIEATSLLRS